MQRRTTDPVQALRVRHKPVSASITSVAARPKSGVHRANDEHRIHGGHRLRTRTTGMRRRRTQATSRGWKLLGGRHGRRSGVPRVLQGMRTRSKGSTRTKMRCRSLNIYFGSCPRGGCFRISTKRVAGQRQEGSGSRVRKGQGAVERPLAKIESTKGDPGATPGGISRPPRKRLPSDIRRGKAQATDHAGVVPRGHQRALRLRPVTTGRAPAHGALDGIEPGRRTLPPDRGAKMPRAGASVKRAVGESVPFR